MSTVTGSLKPTPSIVTSVPPKAEPAVGLIAVMAILATYRKPAGNVVSLPEATLRTRTSTGPVTVPEPFGDVSRAVGDITTISLKLTLMTCASAEPKKTCTGAWNASPRIETRVPPSIGPDVGVSVRIDGVSTAS